MKDRINNKRRGDDSYLAVSRRKRRRYIMIIAIPVAVAAVILGVVFATSQASERGTGAQMGLGAKMVLHIHPKLNVKVNGKTIQVPEQIGIDKSLYKDHSLDKYGMQGMAPLHTHDNSGVIHVESTVNRDYTLGEFLKIWGMDLNNGKSVKVSVNGQPISDWRNHVLSNGEQINLEISG
jgi:sulfur carrier protein ThiS